MAMPRFEIGRLFAGDLSSSSAGSDHGCRAAFRPEIPILCTASFAMWGVAAFYYTNLSLQADIAAGIGLFALACALLASLFIPKCRYAVLATFLLIGTSIGTGASCQYSHTLDNLPTETHSWNVCLTSDAAESLFGSYANAEATNEFGDTYKVNVNFPDDGFLLAGKTFQTKGNLTPVKPTQAETAYISGIVGNISVDEFQDASINPIMDSIYVLREKAIRTIGEYGGESGPLMQALICGWRNGVKDSGLYETFKALGLAHIVAVSGAHLAIVVFVFTSILRFLKAPRSVSILLSSAFVLMHLFFTGVPISAIRAAIMVLLSISAGLFSRRNASLNSLAICIVAFIAVDPSACVSMSLFLSAGATFSIILLSGLISSWFVKVPEILQSTVVEPVSLTVSSNLATLPFSMAVFNQLPLIAPVANIFATPLFSLGCVAGLICTVLSCLIPPLAPIAIPIGSLCCLPLSAMAGILTMIPYGCIAISLPTLPMIAVSALSIWLLWRFWPKAKLGLYSSGLVSIVLCVLFAFSYFGYSDEDEVVMLDVGQGDAILIKSGGSSVLVDTGNKDSMLREELAKLKIAHLDGVLISHADDDHCGCLDTLSSYIEIDHVFMSSGMLDCTCDKCTNLVDLAKNEIVGSDNVIGLDVGDAIKVGDFSLNVIWPNELVDEGGNADSLCLRVTCDNDQDGVIEWQMLFCGDAESDEIEEMISSKRLGDIDVLKVGHHGSKVSLNDEVANMLKPEIALISVGENNRYGHPSKEVMSYLNDVDSQIYRTDINGTITVTFKKNGLKVRYSDEQ